MGTITKCPICGKTFERTEEWAYRRGDVHYCSWHCLRKYDASKTRKERKPAYYTHNGVTKKISEWAKEYGITYISFYHRVRKGQDPFVKRK